MKIIYIVKIFSFMNIKFPAIAQCPSHQEWISNLFTIYSMIKARSGSVSVLPKCCDGWSFVKRYVFFGNVNYYFWTDWLNSQYSMYNFSSYIYDKWIDRWFFVYAWSFVDRVGVLSSKSLGPRSSRNFIYAFI